MRLKEVLLGDCLTSLVKPFIDVMFVSCYFNYEAIEHNIIPRLRDQSFTAMECDPSNIAILVVSYLPFHFRFWQCVWCYRTSGQWFPHMVNAGKYFAGILTVVFNYMVADGSPYVSKSFYIGFAIFSTLYSFGWDILMDWDLLQGTR